MAKKTVTPDPAVTNGAPVDGQPAAEAATAKPKKERLFKTSLNLSDIRKREQEIAGKFNRTGRSVKALGLAPEAETQILDLLRTEFEKRAKEAFGQNGITSDQPAADSMV